MLDEEWYSGLRSSDKDTDDFIYPGGNDLLRLLSSIRKHQSK